MIHKNNFNWEKSRVFLQGSTCAFKDPSAALNMVACVDDESRPVLFIICMQNYRGIPGFILDEEKYSAHSQEGQVILSEKLEIYVLSVQVQHLNSNEDMELAGVVGSDKLTVIHLFCQN